MAKPCEHLKGLTAADFPPPKTPDACQEFSSPGRHATRHFHETQHPVKRSVMPGEHWTWCYVHEQYGRLGEAPTSH